LVARSSEEYVRIAVRLGADAVYRCSMVHAMRVLGGVIWRRDEVVREWELFLMTSVSYSKTSRALVRSELEAAQRRDDERLKQLWEQLNHDIQRGNFACPSMRTAYFHDNSDQQGGKHVL
jgi:hypothetical protein